ncbi:3'-5' exoribonuclease yhaM [Lacticaseibacillus paracasei subsp. paracasei CNCM I-4649]|nr:3'-5' exoribonuclease yhaM [Lacticaseibacillus paracasei subsp. paracasei CNCM I-4649]
MVKRLFDYHNEEDVRLPVLIKSAEVRVAKNGKKFIAMIFQDNSGHISGMFWDASDNDIAQFKAGEVVQLSGKRELYQGNPQIKIFHCGWQPKRKAMILKPLLSGRQKHPVIWKRN